MNSAIDIQNINFEGTGRSMYQVAERLYPICRSITGDGVRKTLSILKEIIPLEIVEVASGTKVLDWEVPEEWNIRDAWIKDPKGKKIVDFQKLNLHVLNYSEPVDLNIDREELKKHLFTLPEQPDLVPYRTSYYKKQWGFCMEHKKFINLEEGNYHVKIDADLKQGFLTYGEFFVPGKTKDEVLFSTHICHPSLCNDNLSGIMITAQLAKLVQSLDLKYSYRFLFIPGTIGSITWLSRNEDKLKNIKYGLVLNLLGDSSPFHYKKSRLDNTAINVIMEYVLKDVEGAKILGFSPYGYDERQFCSPGFNLPVGRLSRKPHGEFPEYHTSADNPGFINPGNLEESLRLLFKVIFVIENNRTWINLYPKGEPQLGKRGLYKQVGGQNHQREYQMAILWVLNLSDGENSMLDIAEKSGVDFDILMEATDRLCQANLLEEIHK